MNWIKRFKCPLCDRPCVDHIGHCKFHWLWASVSLILLLIGVLIGAILF